ncbi:MAG: hypothetical protein PHW03_07210 [Eubacteriales bacterium]|nr:hypothetical protein [Eubacteriales bacterium]
MIDLILNNFEACAGVLLSLALIIYATVTRQWGVLRLAAYKLMLDAERVMASKEGPAKMDEVYAAIWQKVPKWLKRFVTEKTMREKLQEWYIVARNSLKE